MGSYEGEKGFDADEFLRDLTERAEEDVRYLYMGPNPLRVLVFPFWIIVPPIARCSPKPSSD